MIISHGAAAGAREPVNEGTDCRMPSHPPPCAPLPPPPLLPPATPPAPTSAGVQPETGTGGGEERNTIHPHTCMDKWHLYVREPSKAGTSTLIY